MGFGDGTYSGQALNTVNPLTCVALNLIVLSLADAMVSSRDTYLVPSSGWMIVRFITDNRTPSFVLESTFALIFTRCSSRRLDNPLP